MRFLFWVSAVFIGYVYIGYPVLLTVWSTLRPRRIHIADCGTRIADSDCGVSIVIAARNEAHRLTARIENLLALDYPAERRQIIVVSDGSTDDTLHVLARYGDAIDVVAVRAGGKAAALNAGVARAVHDILVFTDARQMFAPDAVRALVAPFVDPQVGGVTGELLLDCEASEVAGRRAGTERRRSLGDRRVQDDRGPGRRTPLDRRGRLASRIADGISLYWRYEKQLRRFESAIGSTLGATGAIYALRRSLFQPLPQDTILDDVLVPMRAVLAGYRVVFSEDAYAFDRATLDADAEQRRKVRTLAGNIQILGQEPRLLLPFVNPVWVQYMSHKLGRLLVPYAMLALFTTSIALATAHPVYALALAVQCLLFLLAGYGAWLEFQATPRASLSLPDDLPAGGALLARLRTMKRIVNA
jgi:biofilm PGA synthesis N-glycosyltransferase PgaC